MRCKFVHEEGLRKGQRCGSIQACSDVGDPMYGYCFRHAVAKKLVSDEKYKDFENKRVAKIIEAQKKRGTPDWGAKSKAKREKVESKRDEEEKRENESERERERERRRTSARRDGDETSESGNHRGRRGADEREADTCGKWERAVLARDVVSHRPYAAPAA